MIKLYRENYCDDEWETICEALNIPFNNLVKVVSVKVVSQKMFAS